MSEKENPEDVVDEAAEETEEPAEDVFAGTAQSLIRHRVPAVVAMQSEVTDKTACCFAGEFYRELAAGHPVDACVGAARQALDRDKNPEWGTPALYLRAADGRLFGAEAD